MGKVFFILILVIIPTLAYFILKPSHEIQSQNIQQTKEFAHYIATNPGIMDHEPSKLAQSTPPQSTKIAEHTGAIAEVTSVERTSLSELDTQWKQYGLVRDQHWRDQVEYLFSVAERTKNPDVLDLLRRQVIEAKNDSQQENQHIARQIWYERYLKLETRINFKEEIEESFQHLDLEDNSSSL